MLVRQKSTARKLDKKCHSRVAVVSVELSCLGIVDCFSAGELFKIITLDGIDVYQSRTRQRPLPASSVEALFFVGLENSALQKVGDFLHRHIPSAILHGPNRMAFPVNCSKSTGCIGFLVFTPAINKVEMSICVLDCFVARKLRNGYFFAPGGPASLHCFKKELP